RDGEVGAVLATALAVAGLAGSLGMALGMLRPELLMSLVSRDPQVVDLGRDYLFYRFAGMLPLLFWFQAKGAFDGIGWTRIGMAVGIGMNALNALLNWIFIFGHLGAPALGVAGAALASSLSAGMAAAVMAGFLLRTPIRKRFRFLCRSNFRPDLLGPFLRLAWPPALQTLGVILGLLVFNALLGRIGVVALAAGNVVLRIASLSFMPGFGVGAAVQTLVGQSLGRGDPAGARRAAWGGVGLAVVFMGLFGVAFVAVPASLMRLFTDRPELVAAGVPILRLMGLVQVIDGLGLTLAGALRGAGLTRAVMLMDVGLGFVLLPPLTYLFGIAWGGGLLGAWLALLTWFTLFAVGMVVIWFRSDWESVRI
ncbi:MATE family efflux transporter, partial [bacterium]|nr:MATE family efflux transporter [bacterium]